MSSEAKLKEVIANVLGEDVSAIGERASVDTIAKWDSLNHMKLVLALEEEFAVSFSGEESVQILSYDLIKAVLAEHGVRFEPGSVD